MALVRTNVMDVKILSMVIPAVVLEVALLTVVSVIMGVIPILVVKMFVDPVV